MVNLRRLAALAQRCGGVTGCWCQQGAVTYVTAIILLLLCSLITLYTVRSTMTMQLLAGNNYFAKQALAAAQAGLADGLVRLSDDKGTLPKGFSGKLSDGGAYRVEYQWQRQGGHPVLALRAYGRPGPGINGMSRSLAVSAVFIPLLAELPDIPLIARADITIGLAAQIENIMDAPLAWAGAEVSFGRGGRVLGHAIGLSALSDDALMMAVFGTRRAQLLAYAHHVNCRRCQRVALPPKVTLLWLQGLPRQTIHLGQMPVFQGLRVLIVSGDLLVDRAFHFDGLIYVTGSVTLDHPDIYIRGVVIAGDELRFMSGRLSYDPDVIEPLLQKGHFARLMGSWHEIP